MKKLLASAATLLGHTLRVLAVLGVYVCCAFAASAAIDFLVVDILKRKTLARIFLRLGLHV